MRVLKRILWLLAIIAISVAGLWYLSRPQPVMVTLARAEAGTVESKVTNTRAGTIKACNRAALTPAMGGQAARLLVKKGDSVVAGQLLLELWNADLVAQVTVAESEAKAAQARSQEACLTADNARAETRRAQRLHNQKLVAQEEMERSETLARASAASCAAAQATVLVSASNIEYAQAMLQRTQLRAPFAGVVAELSGEIGEYITPSPPGIPMPPAIDLVDTSCLYLSAPIDEVDAPQVKTGMPAEISLDAFGKRKFAGSVRRIAPYVLDREKESRTVEIEAGFASPEETTQLLPGYSADVEIITASREQALRIPSEALIESKRVLVYNPVNHTLEQREIKTGLANWQYTEITEGLQAGEQVVTSLGRDGVKNGALAAPDETAQP